MKNFTTVVKKSLAVLVAVPALLAAPQALATRTLAYSCQADVQDPATGAVWTYKLTGRATSGSEGFVQFQQAPLLSVSKTVPGDSSQLFVNREPLSEPGFDGKIYVLAMSRSVMGLKVFLNTETDAIEVLHVVAPGTTLSSQSPSQCQVDEVG